MTKLSALIVTISLALLGTAVPVHAASAVTIRQQLDYMDNTCAGQPVHIVATQSIVFTSTGLHAEMEGTGTLADGTSFPVQSQVNEIVNLNQSGIVTYSFIVLYSDSGPGSRFYLIDHYTLDDGAFVTAVYNTYQTCAA